MRSVIWLVLLFVVAVVAATTLGGNDGLVSIYWGGWRTDLSLNLFMLVVVLAGVAVMAAYQALSALVTLPQRAGEWRALRRERAAHAALREALAEYFGARYSRAQRAAQRALAIQPDVPELQADVEFAVLAHLLAAGSLHRLQDRARRDEMIAAIARFTGQRRTPAARSAEEGVRLLVAEWALDDRDAERALQALAELPPGTARRTQALRLRLRAARLAQQPLEALRTARLLANHQAFTSSAARALLRSLAFDALDEARDAQQLRRIWEEFDPADRRDPCVAAHAAVRAAALDAPDDAHQWLRPFWERLSALERDERDQVALALMEAAGGLGNEWLPRLEVALNAFGHEPAIAAAVGSAYAGRQLWGKAKPLLERAAAAETLAPRARRRAWWLLARLAQEEGDEVRARHCEQAAIQIDD